MMKRPQSLCNCSPSSPFIPGILADPFLDLRDHLSLNGCTSRVHSTVLSDKVTRVIPTRHFEDRPSGRGWEGTTWSQGRDNLTGSPWIVRSRNEDETSRIGEPIPATSVEIGGIVRCAGIKWVCVAILRGEPFSTLPCPVRILYQPRDDCLHSRGCSVLPPIRRTIVSLRKYKRGTKEHTIRIRYTKTNPTADRRHCRQRCRNKWAKMRYMCRNTERYMCHRKQSSL